MVGVLPTCIIKDVLFSAKQPLLTLTYGKLMDCSVDTIVKCKDCEYRYLCGGACRAWGNQKTLDLNAAPAQCSHLSSRAQDLIAAARDFIFMLEKENILILSENNL